MNGLESFQKGGDMNEVEKATEKAKEEAATAIKALDIRIEEYKKWLAARVPPVTVPARESAPIKLAPPLLSKEKVMRPVVKRPHMIIGKMAAAGPDGPELVRDDKGNLTVKEHTDW